METAEDTRRTAIATAITVELQRQAEDGAARIDVDALADAVFRAFEPAPPADEGRRPEDLNSSNDG